ncbi:glyoxalase/bleomycin resistance/extradiol dioxygenase family protein [Weissella muntiaci]|uniref:Glyoxalase/bleomycin resistance/extradiol dioxygenase family protein n=1 Tax=Weissella muntiaci TaxID=2508881 RepID=A0A6C2C7I1_9LACO|nr:glyoxalase/bleomycin resistance/extradiol dioxygenase family protein [Weissella muntiaci]TYC49854.1 glyoxalase/bleomycin resistance/extradiol dioxygenase family protein [Weissella muntiaci]
MATVHPYLTMVNTKEALTYYEDVFGASNIVRMPVAEAQAEQFGVSAEQAAEMTMHGQFDVLGTTVMAADNFMGVEKLDYASVAILLDLNSEDADESAAADAFWKKIAESGQVTINMPYEEQFWGGKMGDFTDKYGVRWMLHAQPYSQMPGQN